VHYSARLREIRVQRIVLALDGEDRAGENALRFVPPQNVPISPEARAFYVRALIHGLIMADVLSLRAQLLDQKLQLPLRFRVLFSLRAVNTDEAVDALVEGT
jgi:hypothetical protein